MVLLEGSRGIQRPPTQHLDAALTGAGSDLDGVIFSAPTLNFAIKELGERGDFERAHALYVWMGTQRASTPSTRRIRTRWSLCSARRAQKHHAKVIVKAWQRALRLKGDALCSEVASAAITALARCENWPAAYQVWRDCGDAGEPRNQWVYTATLTALRDARRWEEAADVFRAMRDEPGGACRPDAKCACLMLEAHNRSRRWREALTLAKRLEDVYEVRFDEVLTHSAIAIAGRALGPRVRGEDARGRVDDARAGRDHVHVQLSPGGVRAGGGLGGGVEDVREVREAPPPTGRVHVHAPRLRGGAERAARGGGFGVERRAREQAVHRPAADGDVRRVRALPGVPGAVDGGGVHRPTDGGAVGRATKRGGV